MTRCRNTPDPDNGRRRRPFNRRELAAISARRRKYEELMQAAEQTNYATSRRQQFALEIDNARRLIESRFTNLVHLSPRMNTNLQSWYAATFGQKARWFGLDPNRRYSIAGEVRHSLADAQQVAEGMITSISRVRGLERTQTFVDTFRTRARELGLRGHELDALIDDTLTVGQIPRRLSNLFEYQESANLLSPATQFNRQRYTRYISSMEDAGFTSAEINQLIDLAYGVTQVEDEIRAIAVALGVDIPTQENIGYLTRVLTEDFKLRVQDISEPQLFEQLRNGQASVSTVFARSRNFNHYIPEDGALAAFILGITPEELNGLLQNPLTWRQYLDEEMLPDQLDFLVDSGVMAKLPMSSREVYDYLVDRYELPYSEISQMFKVDPTQAIDAYARSLMQTTGTAALVRSVTDGRAVAAGWAITARERYLNPQTYNNFVSLGDVLQKFARNANLDITEAVRQMGLATDNEASRTVIQNFQDMYVHPIVAQQWSAMASISASPVLLGQMGRFFYRLNRVLNKTGLGSEGHQFVTRTYASNFISARAAGANLEYVPIAHNIVTRVLSEGYDFLDDTQPFRLDNGRPITQRQFVENFFIRRGQSVAPGTVRINLPTMQLNRSAARALSDVGRAILNAPASTARAMSDIITYTMASGPQVRGRDITTFERIGRLSRATAQKLDNALNHLFEPLAIYSNLSDMASKLAVAMSVSQSPDPAIGRRLSQAVYTQQLTNFPTMEEVYRHIDEYFVNVYDTGTFTATWASAVFPFAVWRMANPSMQLRHMLRHPVVYLNYLRMAALVSGNQETEPEAVYPSWIIENYPITLSRDPRTNEPFTLLPTNYDPILDAATFFRETGNAAQRIFFGKQAGTQEQIRSQIRGEPDDYLTQLFAQTYAWARVPAEQILGMDTFTGRRFDEDPLMQSDSILGFRVSPRVRSILRNIPGINQLDELNPGNIFGTDTTRDIYGNIISVGTPSWSGAERRRRDTDDYPFTIRLLRLMGANVRRIDYDENLQNTLGDVQNTINTLEQRINNTAIRVRRQQIDGSVIDEQEFARVNEELDDAVVQWAQLKFDYLRVQQYAIHNGVLPQNVVEQLWRQRIAVSGLPHPAQEEIDSIVEQTLTWRTQLQELRDGLSNNN